jgi:hypothetical protein
MTAAVAKCEMQDCPFADLAQEHHWPCGRAGGPIAADKPGRITRKVGGQKRHYRGVHVRKIKFVSNLEWQQPLDQWVGRRWLYSKAAIGRMRLEGSADQSKEWVL